MEPTIRTHSLALKILRWTARIIAAFVILFILVMFIGEGGFWSQPPSQPLVVRDYFLLSIFGLYVIGLAIGLWHEGSGGLISLIFMAAMITILFSGGDRQLFYFYLMLLPPVLFLISWYYHRKTGKSQKNH